MRFTREAIRNSRDLACHLHVRIDGGLVGGDVLDAIDDEGVRLVGRIKSKPVLDERAGPDLERRPGRPNREGDEFAIDRGPYQAKRGSRPYRRMLVGVDRPDTRTGLRNLFPHSFFWITNWPDEQRDAWKPVERDRGQGTFEDRRGECNDCRGNGRSQQSFEANETSPPLKMLACHLRACCGVTWNTIRRTVRTSAACNKRYSRPVRGWSHTAVV